MDPARSLSNQFSLRSPSHYGNTLHINASRWFQSAIICMMWMAWDHGSDFPSSSVNFGGSIPSISSENGVWYLWLWFFGTVLACRAIDLTGMAAFVHFVVPALTFVRKSPSWFYFVLRVSQRSTLGWAKMGLAGGVLHFPNDTYFLLLRLFALAMDSVCFYFLPPWSGSFWLSDLLLDNPSLTSGASLIILLANSICVN